MIMTALVIFAGPEAGKWHMELSELLLLDLNEVVSSVFALNNSLSYLKYFNRQKQSFM